MDELSQDERVASAYALWQEMQDEVWRTYSDTLPERLPLSRQKEFKPVRNMVIREALRLSESEPETERDEAEDESVQKETEEPEAVIAQVREPEQPQTDTRPAADRQPELRPAGAEHVTSAGSAVIRMLHHMSRIFRENAVTDATHRGMQIDRKRRKQLKEKRIAMGHKPDDHEEEQGQRMR